MMRFLTTLILIAGVTSASAQGGIETLWTFGGASYNHVALPHDQKYLAGKAGRNGDIEIRSVDDFVLVATLTVGSGMWTEDLQFSPDGKLLVLSEGDRTVRVWNAETWEHLQTMETNQQGAPFAFSSDSAFLYVGNGVTVEKWLIPDLVFDRSWESIPGAYLQTISLTGDGLMLVTSMGGRSVDPYVKTWSAETGEQIFDMPTSSMPGIAFLGFSSDGRWFSTIRRIAFRRQIGVWDAFSGLLVSTIDMQTDGGEFEFSDNRSVILTTVWNTRTVDGVSTYDGKISLWDWKTGRLVTAFPGIANVVSFRGSDEFLYLTPEGHLTRARLPVWLREPTITGGDVSFEWLGREGEFQLQRRESLDGEWENVGEATSARSATVAAEGASGFFRLVAVE